MEVWPVFFINFIFDSLFFRILDNGQSPEAKHFVLTYVSMWQCLVCTGSHDCMNPHFLWLFGMLLCLFVCLSKI